MEQKSSARGLGQQRLHFPSQKDPLLSAGAAITLASRFFNRTPNQLHVTSW